MWKTGMKMIENFSNELKAIKNKNQRNARDEKYIRNVEWKYQNNHCHFILDLKEKAFSL